MKSEQALLCVLAAAALSTAAHAQQGVGKSSEQVRAETQAAIRNGEVLEPSGLTWRQLYPDMYPKAPVNAGLTREEVVADTTVAIRTGELGNVSADSQGEVFPDPDQARPGVAGKTRGEVRQELFDAERSGKLLAAGRADLTKREESPQWYASR